MDESLNDIFFFGGHVAKKSPQVIRAAEELDAATITAVDRLDQYRKSELCKLLVELRSRRSKNRRRMSDGVRREKLCEQPFVVSELEGRRVGNGGDVGRAAQRIDI